jgi:hypothetical protein
MYLSRFLAAQLLVLLDTYFDPSKTLKPLTYSPCLAHLFHAGRGAANFLLALSVAFRLVTFPPRSFRMEDSHLAALS